MRHEREPGHYTCKRAGHGAEGQECDPEHYPCSYPPISYCLAIRKLNSRRALMSKRHRELQLWTKPAVPQSDMAACLSLPYASAPLTSSNLGFPPCLAPEDLRFRAPRHVNCITDDHFLVKGGCQQPIPSVLSKIYCTGTWPFPILHCTVLT